jgi:tRNA A37 N6-isopentenylltransferase MiaA
VRLYSNPQVTNARLPTLCHEAMSQNNERLDTTPRVRQRVDQRLGSELILEILAEYAGGVSTARLTTRYGIGKDTLMRLLRERGVNVRHEHPR